MDLTSWTLFQVLMEKVAAIGELDHVKSDHKPEMPHRLLPSPFYFIWMHLAVVHGLIPE